MNNNYITLINGQSAKPFNLEKALAGEQVVTREGKIVHDVFLYKYLVGKNDLCLTGCIEGEDDAREWMQDGIWNPYGTESIHDLFMASVK